jgi:hydrogenase maturation factor HypF (carbamoyltransferase family)
MVNIYCDACKKKMDNPVNDRTFFHYANFSVCEACKDNLELQVKSHVREKEPFAFDWYGKVISDTFAKAAQKGKAQ